MNLVFLCLGSRGDVQPYAAIGKTASKRGHSVTICTGRTFRGLVERQGLHFYECSLDLMEVLQTEEGKEIFEQGMKHPLKALEYAKRVINPMYRKCMSEFYGACRSADVIVYHPKAFGAVDIAEKLGVLCISMPPIPIIYPLASFANLAITTKNLGPYFNKMTYKLSNKGAESNNIKDINEFREKELILKRRKSGAYMLNRESGRIPIVYPVSNCLFPDVEEFKEEVYLSGFPVLEEDDRLDEETEQFLSDGSKPVIITFSSMPLKQPESFMVKLTEALKESGSRAIILTGNSGMKIADCPDILVKSFVPHERLFPRGKAILHHGGVGTMAAALRSGVPQLIMPFAVDQPFWAKRLHDLGYTLKPLKESDPAGEFAARFVEINSKEAVVKAKSIAELLQQEDGNLKAVTYMEELFRQWKSQHSSFGFTKKN